MSADVDLLISVRNRFAASDELKAAFAGLYEKDVPDEADEPYVEMRSTKGPTPNVYFAAGDATGASFLDYRLLTLRVWASDVERQGALVTLLGSYFDRTSWTIPNATLLSSLPTPGVQLEEEDSKKKGKMVRSSTLRYEVCTQRTAP